MAACNAQTLIELSGTIVGQTLSKLCWAGVMQHRKGRCDTEAAVVGQKCMEQSRLVAEEKLRGEDVRRIVVGEKNVVKMNPGSRRHRGKCVADDLRDLTCRSEGMA